MFDNQITVSDAARVDEKQMTRATDWNFKDLTWWHWSEKFDGVRAFWDGRQFWTRGGRVIAAPRWFTQDLPQTPLDGELWAGRGTLTTATNAAVHGIWNEALRFVVFDAPTVAGRWLQRMAGADDLTEGCAFAGTVKRGTVEHRDEASDIAARIIADGGEGAMFRSPDVKTYQTQRTVNLVRIKKGNLYEPWRKEDWFREARAKQRAAGGQRQNQYANPDYPGSEKSGSDARAVVGLDFNRFPFDPAIEWNIRQILDDGHAALVRV